MEAMASTPTLSAWRASSTLSAVLFAANMCNDGQLAFGFAHHCLQHGLALVHMLVDALTGGTADIHAP